MFKGRGRHNVKEPDFFFLFLFFCFVLFCFVLFFAWGGGVACFSGETEGV